MSFTDRTLHSFCRYRPKLIDNKVINCLHKVARVWTNIYTVISWLCNVTGQYLFGSKQKDPVYTNSRCCFSVASLQIVCENFLDIRFSEILKNLTLLVLSHVFFIIMVDITSMQDGTKMVHFIRLDSWTFNIIRERTLKRIYSWSRSVRLKWDARLLIHGFRQQYLCSCNLALWSIKLCCESLAIVYDYIHLTAFKL